MASFGEKKFMFLIAGGGLKRVVFGDTSRCWVFYLLFFAIGVLDWNANFNAVTDQFNHI